MSKCLVVPAQSVAWSYSHGKKAVMALRLSLHICHNMMIKQFEVWNTPVFNLQNLKSIAFSWYLRFSKQNFFFLKHFVSFEACFIFLCSLGHSHESGSSLGELWITVFPRPLISSRRCSQKWEFHDQAVSGNSTSSSWRFKTNSVLNS